MRSVIPQVILALTSNQTTKKTDISGIMAPTQACLLLAKIYFSSNSANTEPIKNKTICIFSPAHNFLTRAIVPQKGKHMYDKRKSFQQF